MDKLRNLNIAGKLTDGFKNFNSQKMTAFFTYLIIVLVIIAVLFSVYMYLLNKGDLDITFHEKGVNLKSKENKNISSKDLPTVSSPEYTMNVWFAVDKSQYNTKQERTYSHLISYGKTRTRNQQSDSLALGVWIENKTNNIFIVYRTEEDDIETFYDPNSESFNCSNTVTLKNYLLNEWNLLSLVVNGNNLMVYMNGQLYETKVTKGTVYYTQNNPPMPIQIGKNKDIVGMVKNIRFRNKAYQSYEISDLYFAGPKKFVLPDIRGKNYISDINELDIFSGLGSRETNFLHSGADLVDGALGKMNDFFKHF